MSAYIILPLACEEQKTHNRRVKRYWEIIADNLSKAGWSWGWARTGSRLVQKPDRQDRVDFNVIRSPSYLPVRPFKEADPSYFYRSIGSVIPFARLVCVRKTLVDRLASRSDGVREGRLRAE